MTTTEVAFVLRRVGVAVALIGALLSIAVFLVLLLVQHEQVAPAAWRALPLMVFALFGAFGAGMARLIEGGSRSSGSRPRRL